MPEFKNAKPLEDEDQHGGETRAQVADHHHQLAIVAIHHHTGNRRDEQERGDKEDLHQTKRGGAFGFLKHKYGEAKLTHCAGKHGDDLSEPDDGEAEHASGAFYVGFFHIVSFVL